MAQKAFSVGGVGSQVTIEDVVRVALGQGQQVALDTAGAERIKKASPPPKSIVPEQFALPGTGCPQRELVLRDAECRSAIMVKLLQLMNGRSGVRLQVADFLAQLLNNQIVLAVSTQGLTEDAAVLKQIADALHGAGYARSPSAPELKPLSEVLAGCEAPKLTSAERIVMEGGAAVSSGIGCLAVQSTKKLLSLATSAAALSYEALGVQVKALDAELVESQGSVAAASAADEMRGLLEGSKRVGTMKAAENDALPAAFASVAVGLGAALEAVAAAYTAVRAEIQTEALPAKGTSPGNVPSPRLATTLMDLAAALLAVAGDAASRADRTAQAITAPAVKACLTASASCCGAAVASAQQQLSTVGQQLLAGAGTTAGGKGVSAALAAQAALQAAHQAVAQEALTATLSLLVTQGPAAPAAPADGEAAPVAEEAANGDKKAAKKKDKKGGAGGAMVLGKGTALLWGALQAAAAGPQGAGTLVVGADKDVPEGLLRGAYGSICAALDPLTPAAGKLLDELRAVVEANQATRKPKVPKGVRDFLPEQMAIREAAFNTITSVFKRHGAVSIDTPVFELRETLMGKYGEDSKLIYDLADQGGEVLSLRYDLTVPFARYVAVNGIGNIKRYHIGKVYRRDQPQMTRGRFREFFQCDFDLAGTYPSMVADAEVVKVLTEILTELKLGDFEIKLNHRKLLDAMMDIAGVPPQKFRAICSAIDKLDKESWEDVRREMVEDKGLAEEVADKIAEFVVLKGEPLQLLEKLCAADQPLAQHESSKQALEELRTLFTFLQAMGALGSITLDLSLARGLTYYTGLIYEAVLKGAVVGSIAAGGRYDGLVGMFSGKDVPAVGVSIGIERVFNILEAQVRERAKASGKPVRAVETQVLVASIGNNMQVKRMEVCARLWAAGIKAEFGFKANPKMGDQLNYALEEAIPLMVLFGEEELNNGNVKIKDMGIKAEDVVPLADLVPELQKRLEAIKLRPEAEVGAAAEANEAAAQ